MFYLIKLNKILLYFFIYFFFLSIISSTDDGSYDKVSKDYKSTLQQMLYISASLENFFTDNHRYPTTQEGLNILIKNTTNLPNWKGPYIENYSFDKDITKDKWDNKFIYLYPSKYLFDNNPYNLYSIGKNRTNDYTKKDDISNWEGGNIEFYKDTDFILETLNFLITYSPFFLLLSIFFNFFFKEN